MVAANPLFRGTWTLKKFSATVINDIWPEVAFFSLVAASKLTPYPNRPESIVLTVIVQWSA